MFFLLPALAVIAETAATVTGTAIQQQARLVPRQLVQQQRQVGNMAGTVAVGAATTMGIESATAATLGTIAAESTTTTLNVDLVEAGKSIVS